MIDKGLYNKRTKNHNSIIWYGLNKQTGETCEVIARTPFTALKILSDKWNGLSHDKIYIEALMYTTKFCAN